MELHNGDVTFQKKFTKVAFTDSSVIEGDFLPPKGQKFVTLLLGTASKDANDYDVEAALNRLGFVRVAAEPTDDR